MKRVGVEDWQRWRSEGYSRLPVIRQHQEAALPPTWESVADGVASVWLESAQAGRYSYVCGATDRVITGHLDHATLWSGDCSCRTGVLYGSPLAILSELLRRQRAPKESGWPAMTGGLIGVLGFDVVRTWERLPTAAKRDLAIPLYAMIEPRELYIYDHQERVLWIAVWCDAPPDSKVDDAFQSGNEAAERAWLRWQEACRIIGTVPFSNSDDVPAHDVPAPSFDGATFQRAVTQIQEYIAAGDTYQVNVSLRTSRRTRVPPATIYAALRRINPSPYMGFFRVPEFALVCGSPELLVRLVDGVVSSRPIAGTRPRGDAAAQDRHLSAELLASEKERAEHLMLVDLIRNDIGRVAGFGTVHVSEFMAIEQYSHVMHIVSQVEGRLAEGCTWVDVFRSMFPGGTITGCPKIRTMEIIDEIEPVGRGFYTGALGWISYSGEMEMNIVIRSMLVAGGSRTCKPGQALWQIRAQLESLMKRSGKLRRCGSPWRRLQTRMSANSVLSSSVYLNGKIVSAEHAHVSALDQGFLYGVGFFETFRTSGGRPHHWSYNRERLGSSCAKAGMVLPETFLGRDESKLTHTVTELLRLGEASEGVFRYTVSAGDGKALTELLTYRSPPSTTPIHGICMRVLRLRRDNGEWIPRPKSLNYLNALLGARELQNRNPAPSDEGIFLSREGGIIVETPRQNIGWLMGDRIHVPDASLGGVAGTCLVWMQAQGHAIVPARIDLAGFLKAEAIFVCNAVRGITPVAEVWDELDSTRLGEFRSAEHRLVVELQGKWQQSLAATSRGHAP